MNPNKRFQDQALHRLKDEMADMIDVIMGVCKKALILCIVSALFSVITIGFSIYRIWNG